jgi:hypothetical protein
MTREHDDFRVWPFQSNPSGQSQAIDFAGHSDIGSHQRHIIRGLEDLHGFVCGGCFQDGESRRA